MAGTSRARRPAPSTLRQPPQRTLHHQSGTSVLGRPAQNVLDRLWAAHEVRRSARGRLSRGARPWPLVPPNQVDDQDPPAHDHPWSAHQIVRASRLTLQSTRPTIEDPTPPERILPKCARPRPDRSVSPIVRTPPGTAVRSWSSPSTRCPPVCPEHAGPRWASRQPARPALSFESVRLAVRRPVPLSGQHVVCERGGWECTFAGSAFAEPETPRPPHLGAVARAPRVAQVSR